MNNMISALVLILYFSNAIFFFRLFFHLLNHILKHKEFIMSQLLVV